MLGPLDNLLRQILMDGAASLQPPPSKWPAAGNVRQVRFRSPDATWRAQVTTTLNRNALNVYLVNLRENRKLRSNERACTIKNSFLS